RRSRRGTSGRDGRYRSGRSGWAWGFLQERGRERCVGEGGAGARRRGGANGRRGGRGRDGGAFVASGRRGRAGRPGRVRRPPPGRGVADSEPVPGRNWVRI